MTIRAIIADDVVVDVSNLMLVEDFKKTWLDKIDNTEAQASDLRFICGGKIMKDEMPLYSYKIKEGQVISASIRKAQ